MCKSTKGQEKGNGLRRAGRRGRKSSNLFREKLAPQAGLEPATLRLIMEHAAGPKPEPFMQRNRRRVRQTHPGNNRFDVLSSQGVKERRVERAAAARTDD